MRTVMVWRRESDYGRTVEEWMTEYERRTGEKIESLNPDEEENFCRTYDIVEYPTMLALDNDGKVLDSWRGEMLPRFDEVRYWALK